jgi:hypothetical protein
MKRLNYGTAYVIFQNNLLIKSTILVSKSWDWKTMANMPQKKNQIKKVILRNSRSVAV